MKFENSVQDKENDHSPKTSVNSKDKQEDA